MRVVLGWSSGWQWLRWCPRLASCSRLDSRRWRVSPTSAAPQVGVNCGRGGEVDTIKDIAQIIFYVSLSISGPLAVMEYLKAKRRDRLAQEYKIYDELDSRFLNTRNSPSNITTLTSSNSPKLALSKARQETKTGTGSVRDTVFALGTGVPHVQSADGTVQGQAMVRLEVFSERHVTPRQRPGRLAGEQRDL